MRNFWPNCYPDLKPQFGSTSLSVSLGITSPSLIFAPIDDIYHSLLVDLLPCTLIISWAKIFQSRACLFLPDNAVPIFISCPFVSFPSVPFRVLVHSILILSKLLWISWDCSFISSDFFTKHDTCWVILQDYWF